VVGPVDLRELRPHEVLIDVIAAGANFVDGLIVSGAYQIKPKLPFVPGGEITGIVAAAGGPDGESLVGIKVLAMTLLGGFAQKAVARVEDCVPIGSVEPSIGASFAQSFATARYALVERAGVQPGERVVITGAGSGVGLAAVNLAAHFGARPLAIASSENKRTAALAVGAVEAIAPGPDIKRRITETLGDGGVDVVVDVVGGDLAEQLLRTLGFGGRYVVVGFASGAIPRLPANHVLLQNRTVLGAELGSWARRNPADNRRALTGLLNLVADGSLLVPEPTAYRLEDAGQALDDLINRRVVGRAVVDVDASRAIPLVGVSAPT
jgi:NADPH2:quinone reductase